MSESIASMRAREWTSLLRCPVCRSGVAVSDVAVLCTNGRCHCRFPVIDGVPVLINENSSVFKVEDFVQRRTTYIERSSRIREIITRTLPRISSNVAAGSNYEQFARRLLSRSSGPLVLVIGGASQGAGFECARQHASIRFVETDVAFGPRTRLICDAHDLPFADESFDGAVAQAVLEHVLDPHRCVAEVHRVLRPKGIVYAETPFMQQVHGGCYDFTRFTHLGHRRLFRDFTALLDGACAGPGTALAWAVQHFLLSFCASPLALCGVKAVTRLTLFWLKYFDRYLVGKVGGLDAASALYFLGEKAETSLLDRELIRQYRGNGVTATP
jgi:SAM-dependent methyltransferase